MTSTLTSIFKSFKFTNFEPKAIVEDCYQLLFTPQISTNISHFNSDNWSKVSVMQYLLEKRPNKKPFNIVDLGAVVRQYLKWKYCLPTVKPYYAVKSCPDPMVIKMLHLLGCGFDCASQNEIKTALQLGAKPEHILYANPIKDCEHLKYAQLKKVARMTFDSQEELLKIAECYPSAELILRIKTNDTNSVCQFSTKFGASLNEVDALFSLARSLNIKITGVSFHVGSKCNDTSSYSLALKDCREVFEKGQSWGFHDMHIVDIGGGFPGEDADSEASFEEMSFAINQGLKIHFGDYSQKSLTVIAEPGRYFATSSHTLMCRVIGKKEVQQKDVCKRMFKYYLNDGIYGSFNCIKFDYADPKIIPVVPKKNAEHYEATLFGPTCDSIDCIAQKVQIPELQLNEWCYVDNFGAYTHAASSQFNGFEKPEVEYVICSNLTMNGQIPDLQLSTEYILDMVKWQKVS